MSCGAERVNNDLATNDNTCNKNYAVTPII